MPIPRSLLPIAVLATLLIQAGQAQGPRARRSPCRVSRVIDGDTFTCTGGRKVRLLLVDAPEGRQRPAGDSATAALRRLVHRDVEVTLELARDSLDRYGRTLAYVWLADGRLVNEELVREGWAIVELFNKRDQQHLGRLRGAESDAREERRGWWRSGTITCRPRDFRASRCRTG